MLPVVFIASGATVPSKTLPLSHHCSCQRFQSVASVAMQPLLS